MSEALTIQFPTQGWMQFLTTRKELLDNYDQAKGRTKTHEIEVAHGNVAEALLRKWLSEFLPRRYGVTPGYIVSPGLKHDEKMPHYDVIIYDMMNAPVLWIDNDPDKSEQGRSLAIPVEHAACVLEVKSRFSPRTVSKAIEHLCDLLPLMQGHDAPNERYKVHLPEHFSCGLVFFELMKDDEYKVTALERLIRGDTLRNFFGGVILRGEGQDKPLTGSLRLLRSMTPIRATGKASILSGMPIAKSTKVADDFHLTATAMWGQSNFAQFGFDLISMMQGTFEPGRLSSFYGMGR